MNCTAEDVRIAGATTVAVVQGCSGPSGLARVEVSVSLEIGAAKRYDIGLYLATDSGDAVNGTCFKEYLPPPLAPSPTNADLATGFGPYWDGGSSEVSAGDTCGDAEQNDVLVEPVVRLVSEAADPQSYAVLELPCRDSDANGFLDFDYCSGWRQNANYLCTGIAEAGIPGNASKCKCGTVNLDVPVPTQEAAGLTVSKTVMLAGGTCGTDDVPGPFETSVGSSVVYCYSVTASGTPATNRYVANVSLVDDMGTPGDAGDDQTITLSGLSDLDGGGTANDLQAGATATGQSTVVQVP